MVGLDSENFRHRGNMNIKYLEAVKAILSHEGDFRWKDVAAEVGVTERTLYNWRQDPEFQDLLRDMTDRAVSEWIPQVDKSMLREALRGSVGAAQQLYQRAGRTVQVHRDEALDKFMASLDERTKEELEFYVENGQWPEESENVVEGPEGVQ